jgi:hypothetical protein
MAGMIKKTGDEIIKWFKIGVPVAIAAGIVAIVLAMVLPLVTGIAGGFAPLVTSILAMALLILGLMLIKAQQVRILDTIPNFVLLIATIGIVGSLVGLIYAPASAFILDVQTISLGSLIWTLVYIVFGIYVLGVLRIKVRK